MKRGPTTLEEVFSIGVVHVCCALNGLEKVMMWWKTVCAIFRRRSNKSEVKSFLLAQDAGNHSLSKFP
jgi:hypothetical protein